MDIFESCRSGNINDVTSWIKNGNDVNAKDGMGQTPLIVAASSGRTDVVRLLINAKADLNAKSDLWEFSALNLAVRSGHTDVVRLLIDAKAELNVRDNNGQTPLLWAATKGYTDVARLLIDAKADVNANDKNKQTALMFAALVGHVDIVRLLIDAKADVNAKTNNGETALMLATRQGHADIVDMLNAAIKGSNSPGDLSEEHAQKIIGRLTMIISSSIGIDDALSSTGMGDIFGASPSKATASEITGYLRDKSTSDIAIAINKCDILLKPSEGSSGKEAPSMYTKVNTKVREALMNEVKRRAEEGGE